MRVLSTCAAAVAALLALAPRVAAAETYLYQGCFPNGNSYDGVIRCASVELTTFSGFGSFPGGLSFRVTGGGGITQVRVEGTAEHLAIVPVQPAGRYQSDFGANGFGLNSVIVGDRQDNSTVLWSTWQPRLVGGADIPMGLVSIAFSYVPTIPNACGPSGRCFTETSIGVTLVQPASLVTPEPSTLAITGTGLLLVGTLAARRRRTV